MGKYAIARTKKYKSLGLTGVYSLGVKAVKDLLRGATARKVKFGHEAAILILGKGEKAIACSPKISFKGRIA